jgi:hypothetical protein
MILLASIYCTLLECQGGMLFDRESQLVVRQPILFLCVLTIICNDLFAVGQYAATVSA